MAIITKSGTKPKHPAAVLLGTPTKIKRHGVAKTIPPMGPIAKARGWAGYGATAETIAIKKVKGPTLENELLTVLKSFDELVDEEKKQVKKLLFQDGNLKMLDLEIENKFHIREQSNPVRMEVLKLFLDKKMNEAYIMEIIGYPMHECHFLEYAALHFPAEYETKFAEFLKPYPLWQGELYYLCGMNRKPVVDMCVEKLVEIVEDLDTTLYDARDIIDELISMKTIEIGKAALMFSSKTKNEIQHKNFIKQYPESERYFQLL